MKTNSIWWISSYSRYTGSPPELNEVWRQVGSSIGAVGTASTTDFLDEGVGQLPCEADKKSIVGITDSPE